MPAPRCRVRISFSCRFPICLARLAPSLFALTNALAAFNHPAPRSAIVDEGELLIGELNCVSCHTAPDGIRERLDSRVAPTLGPKGLRLTPHWLRRWLADPSATKPGTPMPQLLHGIPPEQRAAAAESLSQFLVSLSQDPGPAAVAADPARAKVGGDLFHTVGCVACHAPTDTTVTTTPDALDAARRRSVPLGDLASKFPAGELVRFLREPSSFHSGDRMPDLGLSDAEATSLATHLLRDQFIVSAGQAASPVPGLRYDYFEASMSDLARFDHEAPVSSGIAEMIHTRMVRRSSQFGLRFSGVLNVPADGEYVFWLTSDDGSLLQIDGVPLIDHRGEHAPAEKSARLQLTAGTHGFTLLFQQTGGGFELHLHWAGPGFSRGPIPASAFTHFSQPLIPVGQTPFSPDPVLINRGRELFETLQCAACHAVKDTRARPSRPARPLLDLASSPNSGCLADEVPASAPRFDLSQQQRAAVRKTIAGGARLSEPQPPASSVDMTLSRLNCHACHSRGGIGGPADAARLDWFRVVGEADLGDEGRVPPHLDHVGAKLKPSWLIRMLEDGPKVRPYMATRMPRFRSHASSLASALASADAFPDPQPDPVTTAREARFGWKLVGRDGVSCIACHTFTTFPSLGIPAMGLDAMAERLQWDWFRRYLPDPAGLRPGTRMPSFWPEGRAVNVSILGGNTDAQVRAIWAWLRGGRAAEVPSGLVRGRHELIADSEPVIYRHFIDGAGSRAIGVGYPERVNLAFDANSLRLALLWQGSFIDTSRHRSDRGVGFEPPLGDHVRKLPAGPAFAVLGTVDAPWPSPPNRLSGPNRFLGYTLDGRRQPTFRYLVDEIVIEETPRPLPGDAEMTLVRHFKLSGDGLLWFRAAAGKIQAGPDGSYLVDADLKVTVRQTGEPVIVGGELRIPVRAPGAFTIEMTW